MKYAENQKYYGNHSSHESPLDQKSDTSHSLSRSITVPSVANPSESISPSSPSSMKSGGIGTVFKASSWLADDSHRGVFFLDLLDDLRVFFFGGCSSSLSSSASLPSFSLFVVLLRADGGNCDPTNQIGLTSCSFTDQPLSSSAKWAMIGSPQWNHVYAWWALLITWMRDKDVCPGE